VLFVDYHAGTGSIQIMTYTAAQGYVQRNTTVTTTLTNGDRLWIRANASGNVNVYENTTLLTSADVSAWPYYAKRGVHWHLDQ